MKAALLGIAALTLGSIGLSAPASALPLGGGVATGDPLVQKTVVVSRTVRRGPFCKTVVTRKVGPGGTRTIRKKVCR